MSAEAGDTAVARPHLFTPKLLGYTTADVPPSMLMATPVR
jgi:hypothetical protein